MLRITGLGIAASAPMTSAATPGRGRLLPRPRDRRLRTARSSLHSRRHQPGGYPGHHQTDHLRQRVDGRGRSLHELHEQAEEAADVRLRGPALDEHLRGGPPDPFGGGSRGGAGIELMFVRRPVCYFLPVSSSVMSCACFVRANPSDQYKGAGQRVGDGEPVCRRDSVARPVAGTGGWPSI
jgi:hypothetical protein